MKRSLLRASAIGLFSLSACSEEAAPARKGQEAGSLESPETEMAMMPSDNNSSMEEAGTEPEPIEMGISGPVTTGNGPFTTPVVDLGAFNYIEEEYFFGGQATSYTVSSEKTMDGKWLGTETDQASFRTRLLVRRPSDAAAFNGTVVVEWLNVSGGVDADPGFMFNHELLLRDGYAWVGVSAQAVGVEGVPAGGFSLGTGGSPLKEFDPVRYEPLVHPGDAFSYDIYSQAARILRGEWDTNVLGGLQPQRLLAYGESQSAGRMVSYINVVHPLVTLFDGFFVHSRGASGSSFDNQMSIIPEGFLGGMAVHIRDDLSVPVLQFQTETDVHGMLGFLPARQPDSDLLRTWEVAGTAHADLHLLDISAGAAFQLAGAPLECPGANAGPQHFVTKAALDALNRWVADGTLPSTAEVLMTDETGAPVTDTHGNTLGGVRTPAVDVPIATHSGNPPPDSADLFCAIFGSTLPFDGETLAELYASHEDYVAKVAAASDEAVSGGFLLQVEGDAIVTAAQEAAVP